MNSSKAEDTPLHHAARGGDCEAVDMLHLLVEFGGNTRARDGHGRRPVDYPAASSPAGACLKAYASRFPLLGSIYRNIYNTYIQLVVEGSKPILVTWENNPNFLRDE